MLAHQRLLPIILSGCPNKSAVTFILLVGERHFKSKVSCPRTQPSASARARTRPAWSGGQRTNHWAPLLLTICTERLLNQRKARNSYVFYPQTNSRNYFLDLSYRIKWIFYYCRLCGSYEAMGLGRISEALQDFTGGLIETINLQTPPSESSPDVYKVLQKALERHSLMGASIEVGEWF